MDISYSKIFFFIITKEKGKRKGRKRRGRGRKERGRERWRKENVKNI